MSERFYINCPLQPGPVELTGAEAHHLARVRRFRAGDMVCLFNGDGREYPARIVEIERRHAALEIVQVGTPRRELSFPLIVAAPLPKGDRGQFLVEKLTETGVTSFVPLATERSVVHPRDTHMEKLRRYVIEASKQCGRNVLLEIEPLVNWADFCHAPKIAGGAVRPLRILSHPEGCSFSEVQNIRATEPTIMAVGPEGGFSQEEISLAAAAGWVKVGLGPRILRIETAALVLAVSLIALRGSFGD